MAASFIRDTARSLRSWRRTPGSALLVILALGLSGGALLTLVTLFNALFLRQLPVNDPGTLLAITGVDERPGTGQRPWVPLTLFESLQGSQKAFQSLAGFTRFQPVAVIGDTTERIQVEAVSAHYFEILGVEPALGRRVSPIHVQDAAPIAMLSFRCWQTRFGADPAVVGRTFSLQGELVAVIGVAPRAFTGLEIAIPTDAWVPASIAPRLLNSPASEGGLFSLLGRLRPEISLEQASAQIATLWPSARDVAVAAFRPDYRSYVAALQPRIDSAASGFSVSGYREGYRRPLALLVLASAITLLLSCVNLSGLLLARWSTREGDLAVRAALGASNGRLMGLVAGESLALAGIATALSAPLAFWSAKGLSLLLFNRSDTWAPLDLSPDYRNVGLMLLLVGAASVCVSLLPIARIRSGRMELLRRARGLPGSQVTRWGRRLVAAQVALAAPLLATAWMVAVNLYRLEGVTAGFRPDQTVVASLDRHGRNPTPRTSEYLTTLMSDLRSTPGVAAAALTFNEPLSFGADWRRRLVETEDRLHSARPFPIAVSPDYFKTLGIRLMGGRDFEWTDAAGRPGVAIISAGLARGLFPTGDPVGRRIRVSGPPDKLIEVIGVSADAAIAEPHAMNQVFVFTPLLQEPSERLERQPPTLLLKPSGDRHSLEQQARRTVLARGSDDILDLRSLQETVGRALLPERIMRLGALYFAGLTTLLVFVGLYAVLNLDIVRRVPEIGLRLALGASAQNIQWMVTRSVLMTTGAGLAVGVPAAFLAGRVVASSLTLVAATDPVALVGAPVLILAICTVSAVAPLRRASRVTPVEALGSQ